MGLRRYSVALAGILYIALTSVGVDVTEDQLTQTVSGAFDAWDKVLAAFSTIFALWSAWAPKPAAGTKQ